MKENKSVLVLIQNTLSSNRLYYTGMKDGSVTYFLITRTKD